MTEPDVQHAATGPVHDECQQDDRQNDDDHPEEKHDDAGDGPPGYCSRSSHGRQLPAGTHFIPKWPALFLSGRLGLYRRPGYGHDLVHPADRTGHVRLLVPALIMLPGEIRGATHENQLEPAERESEPQQLPDHTAHLPSAIGGLPPALHSKPAPGGERPPAPTPATPLLENVSAEVWKFSQPEWVKLIIIYPK